MKIALVGNVSNFATTLAPELRRRGNRVTVFGTKNAILDPPDFNWSGKGFKERVLIRASLKARKILQEWDLVLNYATPFTGFDGPEIIYWQGAELFWDKDQYMRRKVPNRGYYCTPDIKRFLTDDSILLPRACAVDRFKPGKPLESDIISVGHFWRRLDLNHSYYNRYWKRTDVLLEAIRLLRNDGHRIDLWEGPVDRRFMPSTLQKLDVFVDEFCNLSHSMTAVEALLSGTPVIGTYDPALCECPEALAHMTNIPWKNWAGPDPTDVAKAILKAKGKRIDHTRAEWRAMQVYYNPISVADVLEGTWKHFVDPNYDYRLGF